MRYIRKDEYQQARPIEEDDSRIRHRISLVVMWSPDTTGGPESAQKIPNAVLGTTNVIKSLLVKAKSTLPLSLQFVFFVVQEPTRGVFSSAPNAFWILRANPSDVKVQQSTYAELKDDSV